MTDKPLTMKIQSASGEEFEIPAEFCEHCDGTGIIGRDLTYKTQHVDTDEIETVVLKAGDKCRPCCGRGMVGIAGGPPRPITRKPSEMN